ncbi:MAG TPA: hypothetical protein VK186_18550 [Candidatus Deferrimicrobium sp.]|nr:hypothetical protein [Candidatus Kapabacteria bacterium]HLP60848.1 hypothetical protein [Candidatus Deferrimicrobium sp.]
MGSYEENVFHKNRFFNLLKEKKSFKELKSMRPEPIMEPMGMYETLSGHDIIEDDDLFNAFGDFKGLEFQVYLRNMRLFGEKIQMKMALHEKG